MIENVQEKDRGYYMSQVNTDPMRYRQGYLDVVGKQEDVVGKQEDVVGKQEDVVGKLEEVVDYFLMLCVKASNRRYYTWQVNTDTM